MAWEIIFPAALSLAWLVWLLEQELLVLALVK